MLELKWDEAKRRTNLEKHGLDFAQARYLDWENATYLEDRRVSYPEPRYWAFARWNRRLHVVAFCVRGSRIRIISFRKANEGSHAAMVRTARKRPASRATDAEDIPELTRADFARAKRLRDDMPEVVAAMKRGRGRPRLGNAKQRVSLRLDPDVIARLREAGPGWQSWLNGLLRVALGLPEGGKRVA